MVEVTEVGEIDSTELGFEHGCLTFMISIKFGAVVQGFGGYGLDDRKWSRSEKDYVEGSTGAGVIARVLEAMGVQRWEYLKGEPVIAYHEHYKSGKIIAIKSPNVTDNRKKFNLEKYFNGEE